MKSSRLIYSFLIFLFHCNSVFSHSGETDEHGEAFRLFLNGTSLREALTHETKCGLPFIGEVRTNWDRLTGLQQVQFSEQFGRPETETYMISPQGYFRIHYDRTGEHAPDMSDDGGNGIPDYIDSVAAAFDYSYKFQIHILGYDPPENYGSVDPVTGDTLRYDVYVQNLVNLYGFTNWFGDRLNDETDPVPRYRTFIVIDNSYDHTPTRGIAGMKVTAAHELHHAIQIGSYGNWMAAGNSRNVRFFYEITSTWLEDVVYPEINDYLHYLPALFSANAFHYPFYESTSIHMYSRAIWGHMMEHRYDRDIMLRKWEYTREMQPLNAIDRTLREYGSTLEQELAEFYLWKYYTGSRSNPDKYFTDGKDYPMLSLKMPVVVHMGESIFNDFDVPTQTLHYHALATEEKDTVYFLIGNVEKRIENDGFYRLLIFSEKNFNTIPVGNGLWYRLESDNPSAWKVFAIYEQKPVVDERVHFYPNPFRTGQASSVSFVVETDEDIELSIYSSDMRLVYRNFVAAEGIFDRTIVRWNGRDDRNRPVSSGIYIYVLEFGAASRQGKLTLIRE